MRSNWHTYENTVAACSCTQTPKYRYCKRFSTRDSEQNLAVSCHLTIGNWPTEVPTGFAGRKTLHYNPDTTPNFQLSPLQDTHPGAGPWADYRALVL